MTENALSILSVIFFIQLQQTEITERKLFIFHLGWMSHPKAYRLHEVHVWQREFKQIEAVSKSVTSPGNEKRKQAIITLLVYLKISNTFL